MEVAGSKRWYLRAQRLMIRRLADNWKILGELSRHDRLIPGI